MELLMQDVKMHSDDKQEDEEEEDEEEDEAEIARRREEISSNSSKNNNYLHFSSPNYEPTSLLHLHHHHQQHQNSWLGLHHDHHHHHSPEEASTTIESHNSSPGLGFQSPPPTSNFTSNHSKLDLSLGQFATANHHEEQDAANFNGGGENDAVPASIEKEHMFDKVVTPSDVGKLNRLVIPKQHAEKYFPLDSSSNDKGLLLNFEDRNGKLWRFRYSYWNSSQSYVMTKGWSRFVKEKKLDAGDIVSFHRGAADSHRHRLYIDWRRRPDHAAADPGFFAPFLLHQPAAAAAAIRWGGRLFSVPPSRPVNHGNMVHLHHSNPWQYSQVHHHGNLQQEHYYNVVDSRSVSSGSVYSNLIGQQQGVRNVPMIIDSVPVDHCRHNSHYHDQRYYHGKNAGGSGGDGGNTAANNVGKRLRLFGVNMECASSSSSSSVEESRCCNNNVTVMGNNASISSSVIPPPTSLHHHQYLRVLPNHEDHPISSSSLSSGRFHHQRGETSMLFDLDPSLHYSSSSRRQ